MELMSCNYPLLLRPYWRSVQALVSGTSAGSHRRLFFQDQWACTCQKGIGACHEYLALPPLPPCCSSPVSAMWCAHCQGHRISMHERKCTIFAEGKSNVNEKGHCAYWLYTSCLVSWFKGEFWSASLACVKIYPLSRMFSLLYINPSHANLACSTVTVQSFPPFFQGVSC